MSCVLTHSVAGKKSIWVFTTGLGAPVLQHVELEVPLTLHPVLLWTTVKQWRVALVPVATGVLPRGVLGGVYGTLGTVARRLNTTLDLLAASMGTLAGEHVGKPATAFAPAERADAAGIRWPATAATATHHKPLKGGDRVGIHM